MRKNRRPSISKLPPLFTSAAATALFLCQTSCKVGPDYTPPKQDVPSTYTASATTHPSTVSPQAKPIADWWTTLNDPELNKLIDRAITGNLDLQQSTSRVLQSRAALRLAGAKELPTLDAAGAFAHIDSGKGFSLGKSNSGGSSPIVTDLWQAGFDASWEIDIFGGQRRQIEAAKADFQTSVEDRNAALISLTAEVARDYLQLRGLQARVKIAQDNLALQEDTMGLTLSLHKAGFSSELDVSRARTQVSQTRAEIVPLKTQVIQQQHAIATLLGEEPNALAGELDIPAPLPPMPAIVTIGMPTDLLLQRPDIRRAERQIAAANARVGAAIADYYPKFSLTGDFGLDSTKFQHLFDWENRYFIIYPNIDWRILDFGRTASEIEQEKQLRSQTILAYHSAVLNALREVEDALVAYANEQDHHTELAAAVDSARTSVDIARDQYKQGIIDFLQVLDTQRQLLATQDDLAQSDQAISTNLVALYKSVGGGWSPQTSRPADFSRRETTSP